MCSDGEFRRGTLETDEVEWKVIALRLTFLVVGKGIDTIEHGGLFREDLGILDEILPLDSQVQLLEVLQEHDMGIWILFMNDLSERKKSLKSE